MDVDGRKMLTVDEIGGEERKSLKTGWLPLISMTRQASASRAVRGVTGLGWN